MTPTPDEFYRRFKAAFDRYQALLLKWNEKFNLTAITDPASIVEKHFLDSLHLIPSLARWKPGFLENVSRETFSLLDIGSGAGFPGIPLKIVFPEITMVLLDSQKKRCDFLKEVVRSLALPRTEVQQVSLRGQAIGAFDVVATRATLELGPYLRLALPNLKLGGMVLAMKGKNIEQEELANAKAVLHAGGLRPFESYFYRLPVSQAEHQILMTRS